MQGVVKAYDPVTRDGVITCDTREQAEELYRLGYRLAQGYHFGRPVAEPDFRPGFVGGHL